jgi:hypothetical protein
MSRTGGLLLIETEQAQAKLKQHRSGNGKKYDHTVHIFILNKISKIYFDYPNYQTIKDIQLK